MDSSLQNQCRECRRDIETARFCVFCGVTQDNGKPTAPAQPNTCCRRCGQADQLNSSFCTFCGHERAHNKIIPHHTTYAETVSQTSLHRQGAGPLREKNSSPKRKKTNQNKRLEVMAIATAAAVLLGLSCMVISKSLAAKASLLVHVNYPRADVILQDSLDFVVRTSNLDGEGDLELRDLPPGSYQVTIKAFGKKPHRVGVKLFAGRETSVGIDSPISLEPMEPEAIVTEKGTATEENPKANTEGSEGSNTTSTSPSSHSSAPDHGQSTSQQNTANTLPNKAAGPTHHRSAQPPQSLDLLIPVPRVEAGLDSANLPHSLPDNEPPEVEKERSTLPPEADHITSPERFGQPHPGNTEWSATPRRRAEPHT